MTKLLFAMFTLAVCAAVAGTNRNVKVKNLADCTPEERNAVLKRHVQKMGGLVYREPKGSVAIVVVKGAVPAEDITPYAMLAKGRVLEIPFKVMSEDVAFSLVDAAARVAKTGSNAAIFIVDDAALPMTLVAQEAKWGLVNVAPLKADGPDASKLAGRVDRMFTRVGVAVLGGLGDDSGFSAMHPVMELKDVDGCGRYIAPVQLTPMSSYIDKLGIRFGRTYTYLQACKQGWAPAPTNEFQKAIWDKVHEIPSKPIKIEFDPKRDAGK